MTNEQKEVLAYMRGAMMAYNDAADLCYDLRPVSPILGALEKVFRDNANTVDGENIQSLSSNGGGEA
jgi:hypothetical protein